MRKQTKTKAYEKPVADVVECERTDVIMTSNLPSPDIGQWMPME